MSDRDVMFNGEWHARVRVQHAAFLNIAVMTDVDAGVIAPNADEVWAAAGTWNDNFGAAPADIVRVAGGVITDLKRA